MPLPTEIEAQLRNQTHRAAIAGLTLLFVLPCFWGACKVRRTTTAQVTVTTMTVTTASGPAGSFSGIPALEFGSDSELAALLASIRGASVHELGRQMDTMGAGSYMLVLWSSGSDPEEARNRVTTMVAAALAGTQPVTDCRRIYPVSKPRPGSITVKISEGYVVSAEYEPD